MTLEGDGMNSYIQNSLQADEKLEMTAKINKIAIVFPIITFGVCVFILYNPYIDIFNALGSNESIEMVIRLILFLTAIRSISEIIKVLIYILTSVLAFTNKRVISKRGLLSIKVLDSPIEKVNDVDVRQTMLGRILNYGSIIIKTSSSIYTFDYVKDALKFKNLLMTTDRIQKVEIQGNSQVSNSNYDELNKLKELLDNNVITQEEFDKKKKDILGL